MKFNKRASIMLIASLIISMTGCTNNKNSEDSKPDNKIESENTDINNKQEEKDNNEDLTAKKSGSIITLGDKALEIFNGNKEASTEYAKTISNHKKSLGEDIKVYNMIVPTHVEFGLPKKYKDMSKSQKPIIESVYKNLDKDIKTVDAYKALESNKNEYIYFNTDHHWTSLGAYYAYKEFANVAGFKSKDIGEYEKYTKKDFLGTLYTQTQDPNLRKNPDSVDYYKIPYDYKVYRYEKENINKPLKTTLYADYASGTSAYSVFLHGDFPMIKVENKDVKNNKKIAVVKESYGNAFVPFLIPHYKEVFVIDLRDYEKGLEELVKENNIDEVLFINNVFAANTSSLVNKIKNLNK